MASEPQPKVSLREHADEAARELTMRHRVYPGLAPEDALAAMKKAELAAAAANAATTCGWLPPELRHPDYALLAAIEHREVA